MSAEEIEKGPTLEGRDDDVRAQLIEEIGEAIWRVEATAAEITQHRHSFSGMPPEKRQPFLESAELLVGIFEARGYLTLPDERHAFDVVVDDPDMAERHEYSKVMAPTARAAGLAAARDAIEKDPHHGGKGFFHDATSPERIGLIEGVAMYAIVKRSEG